MRGSFLSFLSASSFGVEERVSAASASDPEL
jgi:hypothetical protein